MNQVHAWQATLDADAQVFTTHPMRAAADAARDPADDGEGYWTGTASMPRSAQVGRTAVHLYRPAFAAPTDPLLGPLFGYQPLTHAFFPTERFDEVIEGDGWTAGRRGDGFVALWSWRPTAWTDPAGPEATVPWLQDRYDLVAAGGPDNVWVVEVGSQDLDGDFAEWVRTLRAAPPEVERAADRLAVHHRSPAAGDLRFGTEGPLVLDGAEVPLGDHPRHDSRWATIRPGARQLEIRADGHRLELDFDARRRVVT
jgi:hypothetical protein